MASKLLANNENSPLTQNFRNQLALNLQEMMLRLTRIDEGACYVTETTNLYVAWSMLLVSSKLFWSCGIIKVLDQAKSLADQAFGGKPEVLPKLIEFLRNVESPVLDAVRIIICFENYFKAKMLLKGYLIHHMDMDICRQYHPQFVMGTSRKTLLQKSSPILINEVKQAEKLEDVNVKPLQMLNKQTIGISILLRQRKYRALYSGDQESENQKLFSILENLNDTRNTLHFLNIEYLPSGGLSLDDFVFLRDYVTRHVDALGNKILDERKWELEIGKDEIRHLSDIEYDTK